MLLLMTFQPDGRYFFKDENTLIMVGGWLFHTAFKSHLL